MYEGMVLFLVVYYYVYVGHILNCFPSYLYQIVFVLLLNAGVSINIFE